MFLNVCSVYENCSEKIYHIWLARGIARSNTILKPNKDCEHDSYHVIWVIVSFLEYSISGC